MVVYNPKYKLFNFYPRPSPYFNALYLEGLMVWMELQAAEIWPTGRARSVWLLGLSWILAGWCRCFDFELLCALASYLSDCLNVAEGIEALAAFIGKTFEIQYGNVQKNWVPSSHR